VKDSSKRQGQRGERSNIQLPKMPRGQKIPNYLKMTLRSHQWLSWRKQTTNARKDIEEKEALNKAPTVGGNGMEISAATKEISMEVPQKTKNRRVVVHICNLSCSGDRDGRIKVKV
jgi:hypothetical protein